MLSFISITHHLFGYNKELTFILYLHHLIPLDMLIQREYLLSSIVLHIKCLNPPSKVNFIYIKVVISI